MNWIETLGPSRPPLIANRRFATSIAPDELQALFENLQVDEANAGYKTNIDLQTLCRCLYAAAKMEGEEASECHESEEFREFYKELFSFVEVYMTEFPCLKRSPRDTEVILYCLGTLVDLSKFLLLTIEEGTSLKRVRDAIFVIRTLCRSLDRELPFHQQHEYSGLPTGLLEGMCLRLISQHSRCGHNRGFNHRRWRYFAKPLLQFLQSNTWKLEILVASESCSSRGTLITICSPRRYVSYWHIDYTTDFCGSPAKRRRGGMSVDRNSCRCSECGTLEPHLWIKCLVEHFGRCCPGYGGDTRGFDILKRLLPILHQFPIELTEVVLHLFSKTTETLREDLRSNLIIPFMEFNRGLVERGGRELDRASVEIFVIIVKHLRSFLKFLLPVEIAQNLVTELHNLIQETLLEVMAVESESGITPGEGQDNSVFDETLLLTYPPAKFSLHSVIRQGVGWITSALHMITGGQENEDDDRCQSIA